MKRYELPLLELTFAQKLDLMESIWDSHSGEFHTFQSPDWHEEVLRDREKALATGKISISDWEEAKERIRKSVYASKDY